MNENPQETRHDLSAMEYFILALVGRMELTSLYAFKEEAGLEPGGIRPALNRLEKGGLLTRTEPRERRRRDMALTPSGYEVLNGSWTKCVRHHAEAESVIRSAFVALVQGGPAAAADYLLHVGESHRDSAEQKMNDVKYLERSKPSPLSSYAWMRASHEAHRRKADSEAFLSMSRSIRERFTQSVDQESSNNQ